MSDITKRIRICHDSDYEWNADDCIHIAYLRKSRECLGTEAVTQERMDEIRNGIADGSLVGMPVYAYVHSGATVATTPFSCPWDSGQSGFVYMTKEDAADWNDLEKAKSALTSYVSSFDQYLRGEACGFIAEKLVHLTGELAEGIAVNRDDWFEVDSCWGFLGTDPKKNGIEDYVEELIKRGYVYTDEEGKPI